MERHPPFTTDASQAIGEGERTGEGVLTERRIPSVLFKGRRPTMMIWTTTAVEAIARVCHEANRAYCLALNDTSQPAWDDAPAWQQDSARHGVEAHLAGGLTPEQSHESWLNEKIATGWVYGLIKDPDEKTHPCCVPYADLPEDQRRKDKLFGAIVNSLK